VRGGQLTVCPGPGLALLRQHPVAATSAGRP